MVIGTKKTFCVQAIGLSSYASAFTCVNATVDWIGTLLVDVKSPSSLGVPGVSFSWELLGTNVTGNASELSGADGSATIQVGIDLLSSAQKQCFFQQLRDT